MANAPTTEIERLLVRLVGDGTLYEETIDSAVRKTLRARDRIVRHVAKIGDVFTDLGKTLSLRLTLPITALGALMLRTAVNAGESANKFREVFKTVPDAADDAVQQLNRSYGFSRVAARQALADTGGLLVGFGFTRDAALQLSLQVQKLAADLASFTNIQGGAEQASIAITRGLLGEREMLKSLNIAILEKDVTDRVAINTTKGLTFQSERLAKAYATLQLITEQAGDAVGDYGRTNTSTANRLKDLNSAVQDLSESFGRQLEPVLNEVVATVQKIVSWIDGFSDSTKKLIFTIGLTVAALGPLLTIVGGIATNIVHVMTLFTNLQVMLTGYPVMLKLLTASVVALKLAIVGLGVAVAGYMAYNFGAYLAEQSEEVKKARQLQAEAEQQSLKLDAMMAQRQTEEAIKRAGDELQSAEKSTEKLNAKVKSLTRSLIIQKHTFGLSARETKIATLALEGATREQLLHARVLDRIITLKEEEAEAVKKTAREQKRAAKEAQQLQERMRREARGVVEQLFPIERFKTVINRLADLVRAGQLDIKLLEKAGEQAIEALLRDVQKQERNNRRLFTLGASDVFGVSSTEADIRAQLQRDALAGTKKENENLEIAKKAEKHLEAIRMLLARERVDQINLRAANFQ